MLKLRLCWLFTAFVSRSENKEIKTFVIISDDGLEGHELHVYISRTVGIFIVGICGETESGLRHWLKFIKYIYVKEKKQIIPFQYNYNKR